jgi:hypothetical protein
MTRRSVGGGYIGQHQPRPEHARRLLQVGQVTGSRGFDIREDHVHSKRRGVLGEDFQVLVR